MPSLRHALTGGHEAREDALVRVEEGEGGRAPESPGALADPRRARAQPRSRTRRWGGMRRAASIAIPALLTLASTPLAGCFVFEELEKGEKIMEQHTPVDAKSKKADAEAAEAEEGESAGPSWWSQARSLDPGPATDRRPTARQPSVPRVANAVRRETFGTGTLLARR